MKDFSTERFPHFEPAYFHTLEFAHRGGYANGPENHSKTIIKNIDKGLTAFEVDIRMTGDEHLVVFHDEELARLLETDRRLDICQIPLDEVQKYPMRNRELGQIYVETFDQFLREILSKVKGKQLAELLIELDFKVRGDRIATGVQRLFEVFEGFKDAFPHDYRNHFYLSSFYPNVLKEVRKHDKHLVTGFAVNNRPDKDKFLGRMAKIFANTVMKKYDVQIFEPNMCMLTPKKVQRLKTEGKLINAWSANTKKEKEYLKGLQVAFTSKCPKDTCKGDPSIEIRRNQNWCKELDG